MLKVLQAAKVLVILLSFETLRKPQEVDEFVQCHDKRHSEIEKAMKSRNSSQKADESTILKHDSTSVYSPV